MSAWLSMLVGSAAGPSPSPSSPTSATRSGSATALIPDGQSPRELILRFSDRLKHAMMADDRRAALMSLKGLAREYKRDVGECSLHALASVLVRDAEDPEMLGAALDTLAVLFAVHPNRAGEAEFVPTFVAEFADDAQHVTSLLDVLDSLDYHLRFDALQLLSTLVKHHPTEVIAGLLANPAGVNRLIDQLSEPREAVRTEAILLLIALTASNAEVQKIVAFQNAFDTLFDLLQSVDPFTAEDVLKLVLNLVCLNPSNQTLFRETGGLRRLAAVLDTFLPPDTDAVAPLPPSSPTGGLTAPVPFEWTRPQIAVCTRVIDVLRAFITPSSAGARAAQDALVAVQVLGLLLELSLAAGVPVVVKAAALRALGETVRGHPAHQAALAESVVYVPQDDGDHATKSALLLLVNIAVLGVDEEFESAGSGVAADALADSVFEMRRAALYALQCFLYDHPDGKLTLAMTAVNPPPDELPAPTTSLAEDHPLGASAVLRPLIDWQQRDDVRTWFAAMVACSIVHGNARAKEVMAGMYQQLMNRHAAANAARSRDDDDDDDDEDDQVTLVQSIGHTLVFSSRGNAVVRTQTALLAVLVCWTWGCPEAVGEIVADGTIMQFLIEQVSSASGHAVVQGLAAFLLGTCYEFHPGVEAASASPTPVGSPAVAVTTNPNAMTPDQLYQAIAMRIGVDQVQARIARLREDRQFAEWTSFTAQSSTALLDDVVVAHISDRVADLLRGLRMSPEARSRSVQDLEERTTRVAALEARVRELEAVVQQQAAEHAAQMAAAHAETARVTHALDAARASLAGLEREQEELLVCLAEQDTDMKRLRDRLRALGDTSPDVIAAGDAESPPGAPPRIVPLTSQQQHAVEVPPPAASPAAAAAYPPPGAQYGYPASQYHQQQQQAPVRVAAAASPSVAPSAVPTRSPYPVATPPLPSAPKPATAYTGPAMHPLNAPVPETAARLGPSPSISAAAPGIQPSLSTLALMQSTSSSKTSSTASLPPVPVMAAATEVARPSARVTAPVPALVPTMMSHDEAMRKHQEEINAVLKAEQDLIEVQKQQATMNAGYAYQAPQQQQQWQQPPPQQQYAPEPVYQQPPQQQPQRPFNLRRVRITLVEARNLRDVRINQIWAEVDPYVKVWTSDGQKHKSPVFEAAGLNPQFGNAQMEVAVDGANGELTVAVWEYDNILPSLEMGRATYALNALREGRTDDTWLQLRALDGGFGGEIHIVFTPLE
ncbi:Vesicle-mediated ER to Golgi transport protein [Blastocladiella emersonii ATCC 22665]|nr:Vesicle-mediated ER to Golgi transport protein [Blastocladiella emersonii ATCC 22665]